MSKARQLIEAMISGDDNSSNRVKATRLFERMSTKSFTVTKPSRFHGLQKGEVYKPTGKHDPFKGLEYFSGKNKVWFDDDGLDSMVKNRNIKLGESMFYEGGKDPEIAKTILQQLGGAGKLKAMLGVKNIIDEGNGLSFRFKNPNKNKGNYFKVTLDEGSDTYDLEIGKIAKYNYTKLKEWKGIYVNQVKKTFEKFTGLRMSL